MRGQIEQILLNLIINARQAMPRGGRLAIDVRENALTQMAEIRIADSGAGIPPDQLPRVFEPLFTTRRNRVGLGLTLCRRIVAAHQGTIAVESEEGQGTRVIVRLPIS